MQHSASTPYAEGTEALVQELTDLVTRLRAEYDMDPFGNPILSAALSISRRLDAHDVDLDTVASIVACLRDAAFDDRASRVAAYVGGTDIAANLDALKSLAARLVRPDPADSPVPLASFRSATERTRFAAVFTAHPTFSLPAPVETALAEAASGREAVRFASHRPGRITLEEEFSRAAAAIHNGRDALDLLSQSILTAARATWPGRWTDMIPRPVILTSWVGYDTDGRNDIFWWDTFRLRLRMKHMQLARMHHQLVDLPTATALAARIAEAEQEVAAQLAACPTAPDAERVAAFGRRVVSGRDAALFNPEQLLPLFQAAIDAARSGWARHVAGAHSCSPEFHPGPQRCPPASWAGGSAGGSVATPWHVERDQPRAGHAQAGRRRFRRAAGRAGFGRAADDDGGANRQTR